MVPVGLRTTRTPGGSSLGGEPASPTTISSSTPVGRFCAATVAKVASRKESQALAGMTMLTSTRGFYQVLSISLDPHAYLPTDKRHGDLPPPHEPKRSAWLLERTAL